MDPIDETVRTATQSQTSTPPKALPIKSAITFTIMVQVPCKGNGSMKSRMPMIEGTRNLRIKRERLFAASTS